MFIESPLGSLSHDHLYTPMIAFCSESVRSLWQQVTETQVNQLNCEGQVLPRDAYSQGTQKPKDAPSLISLPLCYSFNFLLENVSQGFVSWLLSGSKTKCFHL